MPGGTIDRIRAEVAALRFHLGDPSAPIAVAMLGGTGTGKSTLVNRIVGMEICAASFQRTFTAGVVAVTGGAADVPKGFLAIEHRPAEAIPARGMPDALTIAAADAPILSRATILDTPDLDGDQPSHHLQADRAFRWAVALVFVVTPEKYQMNEMLAYYRLAHRYGVPALFVMNKVENSATVEDYRGLLTGRDWPDARLFSVPRDDAAYVSPAQADLPALCDAIAQLKPTRDGARLRFRAIDLAQSVIDRLLQPLREQRALAGKLIAAIRSMEAPEAGIDLNPVTQQLQRRLQQRSVLYLIGPQRVLERARQIPGLLVRLPRTAWDVLMRGQKPVLPDPEGHGKKERAVPDFPAALGEQLSILQSRIDDILRGDPVASSWANEAEYDRTRLSVSEAAAIAQEELDDLKAWLERRWNAAPRDTALLLMLLRRLPGGEKLMQWTEAAPYLLTIVVATHHAFFGHVDLLVIGGFSLATWLSERISNEVGARTRAANRRIAERFAELAHRQIETVSQWLEQRTPPAHILEQLQEIAEKIAANWDETSQTAQDIGGGDS